MSEPYMIKMPQLSDTMTEGVLVSWEKNVGDEVKRGDIVATVETDKAIMDVEIFRDGYLSGPVAEIDSTVAVGEAIAYIVADAGEVTTDTAAPATTSAAAAPVTEAAPATPEPSAASNSDVVAPDGVVTMIKMPQLSDTMTEGVVVSWEKSLGDKIERGDIVAQVETDKAIMDVEVFKNGYLSGPMAETDSVVPVGGLMAYIVESADNVVDQSVSASGGAAKAAPAATTSAGGATSAASSSTASSSSVNLGRSSASAPAARPAGRKVTPFARKLASQLNVNLDQVSGSGAGGVVTAQDVQESQGSARGTVHAMAEAPVPGDGRNMNSMEKRSATP